MADLCADARLAPEHAAPAPARRTGRAGQRSSSSRPADDDLPINDWRGFHDALRRAALAATQSGTPLSLLLLEPAGAGGGGAPLDAARSRMETLAGVIAAEAGVGSALARYAEARLAVIMLETCLGDAIMRAERIGSLCAGAPDAPARPAIGVAQFRDDEALGHLIERAEDALDRARSDGALVVVASQRARSIRRRPMTSL